MILDLLLNNIVLICMVVFLVLLCLWGRHRGFIRMITSTAAMTISLFLARWLMPKLSARMIENKSWLLWVETKVMPKLNGISVENVFNGISFLLIFVVAMILIRILAGTLDRLTEGTPLSVVNEIFGLLLGIVEGIVFIWIFMIFVDIMPQFSFCEFVSKQISTEPVLKMLHDNNLVVLFLQSVLEKTPAMVSSPSVASFSEIVDTVKEAVK